MVCSHCQQPTPIEARFCPNCGSVVPAHQGVDLNPQKVFSNVASTIQRVAGVDTPSELKLRDIFSSVFKSHTEDEAEQLFIVGTRTTTPPMDEVADTWPKPWLFARVFLLVAVVYFGLYIGFSTFSDLNFLPGLIIVGSFMVPISLLIFFWEMNAPRNISIYAIIKMVFIGGVLSLIAAMVLYQSVGNTSDAIIIGIVEEVAKALVVLWFLRGNKHKRILNGMLIGAAIGTGFAAFESAGYALDVALSTDLHSMYSTIFWRGVLAPGGHIIWAALTGAAICMVKGDQDFAWSMLKDMRFIRIFAIVVVLHVVWDSPIATTSGIPVVDILLTIVAWIIAFAVMAAGLKQISQEKAKTLGTGALHAEGQVGV